MASVAPRARTGEAFLWRMAVAMAAVVVAGFAFQFAMGRSSLAAPAMVHAHAVVAMGWVAIFVAQARLGTAGAVVAHRRLGRVAAAWAVLMVAMSIAVTLFRVRQGAAPFFFQPQHFLIANPLTALAFGGMVAAAVAMRRRADWHARLQVMALVMILGPAFGRLLPSPLLIPWAFEAAVLAGLIFPAVAAVVEWRRDGRPHPAWLVGTLVLLGILALAQAIAASPLGDAIYAAATAGTPGAAVPGMAFGTMPG